MTRSSGLVGVAPTDMPTAEFARRFRRMVLAGPLASLVLSPFALVAFWWGISSLFSLVDTPDASPGHGELLPLTFGAALFVGMIAGLVTFIPAQAGGMASDGATIRLLSDPENAAAIQRMLQTTALAFGTRRPRGWSSSEIAKLQRITLTLGRTPLQRQHQLSGALLLTCAYIDHQRFEDAIRVAAFSVGQESGQQADGETQQQALLAFYAYLSAIDMSNGLAAQAALARISEGSPVRRTGVFKSAEALVLAGRGEREAALQAVRIAKVFAARGAMLSKTALVEVDMAAAALIAIDSFDSFGTVSPSSAAHMIGKAA